VELEQIVFAAQIAKRVGKKWPAKDGPKRGFAGALIAAEDAGGVVLGARLRVQRSMWS